MCDPVQPIRKRVFSLAMQKEEVPKSLLFKGGQYQVLICGCGQCQQEWGCPVTLAVISHITHEAPQQKFDSSQNQEHMIRV
jgi:hypothetical protein